MAPAAGPSASPRGETILVVDDDRAFRVAARTMLEDDGYTVILARGGEEALLRLGEQPVDLVLTDLMMEQMSGLTLLAQLRARSPELPVIMVTGFGSIQTAIEAMRLGAADYVTKPHNNDELLIKIRRTLDIRGRTVSCNRFVRR